MRRIHLVRYEGDPGALAPLLAAIRAEGLRAGWLDVAAAEPVPVPPALDAAASAGAFRSVAVGEGRAVTVKRQVGPPVLSDLLREHFLGCSLVVVRGAATGTGGPGPAASAELAAAPVLEAAADGFRVLPPGAAARRFEPAALAARLRRPRPW